jgi:hypothetical protein
VIKRDEKMERIRMESADVPLPNQVLKKKE